MKKIILMFVVLFATFSVQAQSEQPADYAPAFTYNGVTHNVDASSVEFLPQRKVVFWSASALRERLLLLSVEVDCPNDRMRFRAFKIYDRMRVISSYRVSPWLDKSDPIAEKYIYFGCN